MNRQTALLERYWDTIDPAWCVVESRFRPDRNQHYESNFTTGSGYLSARGVPEEGAGGYPSTLGTFVPGIYAHNPKVNTEVVNLPCFWGLGVRVGEQLFHAHRCRTRCYRRWLDLRDGTLRRTVLWLLPDRHSLALIFERTISLDQPHLALQRLTLLADHDMDVVVTPGLWGDVQTSGWDHFTAVEPQQLDGTTLAIQVTTTAAQRVAMVSPVTVEGARAGRGRAVLGMRTVELSLPLGLRAGQPCTVCKYTAVATTHDPGVKKPLPPARTLAQRAARTGWEQLFAAHARAWARCWKEIDVTIEGDPSSQLGIRFAMFHMVRSHRRDPRVSIDAKCFSSDGYRGRIFWDTEIYMLPFFLYTNPAAARQLVEYRYVTLPGARTKARRFFCEGAMFPWESAVSGDEEVHLWEHDWAQIHVTGEVAYGVWHYLSATEDDAFFRRCGAETIIEAARFWSTRCKKRVDRDQYEIRWVIGPDEYSQFVNNNYHTNFIAAWTMRRACDCLERLQNEFPTDYRRICRKLGIDDNLGPRLRHIADRMFLPYDAERDLILMDEEFIHRDPFDVEAYHRHKRNWRAFLSPDRMMRSQGMKQADVCVTMNLFPDAFTAHQKEVAYDLYEPITTHDSSLSRSSYAIVAADIGRTEEAYRQSQESIAIDLDPERNGAAGGLHAANQGAVWYVTTRAFAGMRIADGTLAFAPKLPAAWSRLAFCVRFRNRKIAVEVLPDQATFTLVRGEPLDLLIYGKRERLQQRLEVQIR